MEYDRGVTSLAPWGKGVCNKTSARNLQDESVRNAVNVDFVTDTVLRRREGLTKVYSGLGLSKGFSCPAGRFFVEGADLKRFNAVHFQHGQVQRPVGIHYNYLVFTIVRPPE